MKLVRAILITTTLTAIIALAVGCQGKSTAATTTRTATAQRGNVQITVTAVGNLAFSQEQDLAQYLSFATDGTITDVLVKTGDSVKKGQVLARLDSSVQDDNIKNYQKTLTSTQSALLSAQDKVAADQENVATKQRAVETAKYNLTVKQRALETAKYNLTVKQRAVTTAQLNVQKATNDLVKAQADYDNSNLVSKAQQALNTAQYNLTVKQRAVAAAQLNVDQATITYEKNLYNFYEGKAGSDPWILDNLSNQQKQLELTKASVDDALQAASDAQVAVNNAQAALDYAIKQDQLSREALNIQKQQLELTKASVDDALQAVKDGQGAVNDAQVAVNDAQNSVQDALAAVAHAQTSLTIDQSNVDVAKLNVADALANLDEAKAASLQIWAPFDGVVSAIANMPQANKINAHVTFITINDPTKLQADILVSETDIAQVKVGTPVTISIDSLSGFSIPARVTSIAPTATNSQGVVMYKVTSILPSLQDTLRQTQGGQGGQPPNQGQGGGGGQQGGGGGQRPQGGQRPSANTLSLADIQLRQGLTATVTIVTQQRNNVVMVPNQAITTKNQTASVNVISNGAITARTIKTGISNLQYTEVTEGLSEGEQVVLPTVTPVTTTTSNQRLPNIFGGGGGGPPPPGGGR